MGTVSRAPCHFAPSRAPCSLSFPSCHFEPKMDLLGRFTIILDRFLDARVLLLRVGLVGYSFQAALKEVLHTRSTREQNLSRFSKPEYHVVPINST
jgi:hypothetical protein